MHDTRRSLWLWLISAVAIIFGALTIKSGGTVIFGGEEARIGAGHYVGFVLWFNFLAGFAYVFAGVGVFRGTPWAPPLAAAIALLTVAVFAAFGVHVLNGGAFEQRTVVAMSIRSVLWILIALYAFAVRARGLSLADNRQ